MRILQFKDRHVAVLGCGSKAYSWKCCLPALLSCVCKVQEHGGNPRRALHQGVIMRTILLAKAVSQDLHVFLMTDVEVRPFGQP